MKKFYLFLGAALLSGSMMAATLDTIQVDGVYYQLNEETQTAAVIRKDSKFIYEQESVVIPVSVSKDGKSYDVTGIGKAAFSKAKCKSIVFAEGSKITEIGQQAFQGALELTELALPEGVKHLQLTAIQGVGSNAGMKLHKLTLPSTMDTLDVMSLQVANLDTLICNAVVPPHCALATGKAQVPCLPFTSNNATVYTPKATKVIVPAGSETLYAAENGWDYFDCFNSGNTDTLRAGNLFYIVTYTENDTTAAVTVNLTDKIYQLETVVIPATISKTVCAIPAEANGKASITQFDIPVTALGRKAFMNDSITTSFTFATPSNVVEIASQAMQYMAGLTGTLELPEGLKHISISGIHSGLNGGQMPVKKLILPSTLDSLDVISVILDELETLEFRGIVPPHCQTRETKTYTQMPWLINEPSKNQHPTPTDVEIIIPEGSFEAYKAQTGIGDYFDYFNESAVDNIETENNNGSKYTGIYNIMGTYLGTDDSNLPTGMYIINGKKVIR